MLFNSLEFALFFVIVLAVYWALPHRGQNRWLLVASYIFYGAWDWRFLGLILLSTVVDFHDRSMAVEDRRFHDAAVGWWPPALLQTWEYSVSSSTPGSLPTALSRLLNTFGLTVHPFILDIVLPVGISFYTFQTLSYTIDVYRRKMAPTRDFLDFALFVAFFPQLVAGPIERARRLLPQIVEPRHFDLERMRAGAWLVLWGLFKKVVIGDNIAAMVNAVYAPGASPEAPEVVLGTYAFAIQIYCDFSGYSDIARGIARMLGF